MNLEIFDLILVASGLLAAWCFTLAYHTHRRHKKKKRGRLLSGIGIGSLYAVSLCIFMDLLLRNLTGESFLTLALDGSYIPAAVFLAGAALGVLYEYVGSFALNLWYYPSVRHEHKLFLILPFFWAVFMLIMQDTYAISRYLGLSESMAIITTSLIPFALIEGINVYTKTWIYKGVLRQPVLLAIGWFIMTIMFVVLFNKYILSPFGY